MYGIPDQYRCYVKFSNSFTIRRKHIAVFYNYKNTLVAKISWCHFVENNLLASSHSPLVHKNISDCKDNSTVAPTHVVRMS